MVKKYGLPMLVTADESVKEYLQTILQQVQGESRRLIPNNDADAVPGLANELTAEWLLSSSITRLVLAIKSVETDETLERWQFDIHTEESAANSAPLPGGAKPPKKKEKTEKDVQGEIREIMKQITSSVTFLPILEEECESNPCLQCAYGTSCADMQAHSRYWRTRMTRRMWLYQRRGMMRIRT
jgi:mitotic spindle assembly checkpoint protein MAD2